jgi:hypothetical protein
MVRKKIPGTTWGLRCVEEKLTWLEDTNLPSSEKEKMMVSLYNNHLNVEVPVKKKWFYTISINRWKCSWSTRLSHFGFDSSVRKNAFNGRTGLPQNRIGHYFANVTLQAQHQSEVGKMREHFNRLIYIDKPGIIAKLAQAKQSP